MTLSIATGLLVACGAPVDPRSGSDPLASSPHDKLAALLPELIENTGISGLSIAVVTAGEIAWSGEYGVANVDTGEPVTADTVFEAASLSKPVLAYLALRMIERGELDLDSSLHEILEYERFADTDRARALTPRRVLSHQTGLPNWGGDPLTFEFDPGTRFGYSGEGYVYLQQTIESQTGATLEELARREIFEPLGMANSRFTWPQDELPSALAVGHDAAGKAVPKQRPEANAASSLHTTAKDYARFVVALLSTQGLDPETLRSALQPEVVLQGDERGGEISEGSTLSWGLGWGLQEQGGERIAWHWGDNGVFRAFVAFRPEDGAGIVYLTNSLNGLSIAGQTVEPVVGDMSPTTGWLAYEQSTDPTWTPRRQGILAENAGDYEAAVTHFERVLELDPDDDSLAPRIAWLRDLLGVAAAPVSIPHEFLQRYAGRYGPRTLSLVGSELRYQRQGRPGYTLTALTQDTFALDGMVDFRLQVIVDEEGRASKLIGHYLGGETDESLRDEGDGAARE